MKSIIMSADDYAYSESIDEAIIKLIKHDRLSATSCMVLSPRWKEAGKLITPEIKKKASIGLHLDFTQFGNAYPHGKLILLSLMRRLPKESIKISINKQLDAFEEVFGSSPDYVDGHQHVHQLPQIRDGLIEVLLERYQNNLPWLRIAKPPVSDGLKGLIIRLLGANALEKKALAFNFKCSTELLGVYGFNTSPAAYELLLSKWIRQAKKSAGVPALMCHPAIQKYANDKNNDPIFNARLNEYQVLNSEIIGHLLDGVNVVKSPA
jgi:chitin disaccharide deacetylase